MMLMPCLASLGRRRIIRKDVKALIHERFVGRWLLSLFSLQLFENLASELFYFPFVCLNHVGVLFAAFRWAAQISGSTHRKRARCQERRAAIPWSRARLFSSAPKHHASRVRASVIGHLQPKRLRPHPLMKQPAPLLLLFNKSPSVVRMAARRNPQQVSVGINGENMAGGETASGGFWIKGG